MSPLIPANKRLVNEDNDDNPETTDTSLSEKDYISHNITDNFTGKKIKKKKQWRIQGEKFETSWR